MRIQPGVSGARAGSVALPAEIGQALRRFRRRVLGVRAGWRLGVTAASAAWLAGAALALDRFLLLGEAARIAATATAAGVTAILVLWSLAGLLRPPGKLELARGLEAEEPGLSDGLLTSVEIALRRDDAPRAESAELTEALFRATAARLGDVGVSRWIPARRSRLAIAAAASSWIALIAAAAADREASSLLIARFLHPASDLERPSTVVLDVSPGTTRIAKGDDVDVSARIVRGAAAEATLSTRFEGSDWTAERRGFDGGAFTRKFTAVRRALEYRVAARDFASPVFRIDVRDPPAPVSFRMTYRYPEYTGRAPETVERATGDIAALAGTRVDLEVQASEPLASARIELGGGAPARPFAVTGRSASIEGIDVAASKGYRLFLEARDGVSNAGRAQFAMRAFPDKPPSIEILEPRAADVAVEDSSVLTLRYAARDDVGVRAVELLVEGEAKNGGSKDGDAKNGAPDAKTIPLDARGTEHRLDVSSFGLRPGASVNVTLRARDGLAQEALSTGLKLHVGYSPDPPEGPGWPRPLDELEAAIAAALEDWAKLLPSSGEAPETLAADGARAEALLAVSEKSLGTMDFLRSTAEKAIEAGRAISIPSPNRDALEGVGRALRHIAGEECAAFWNEAAAVAGAIRASASAKQEPVPSIRLHATHREAGSRIDAVLGDLRAVERAERMEEALERCMAVEHALGTAPLAPERAKGLAGELTSVAAELTKLARSSGGIDEPLDGIARELLESAAPAIASGTDRSAEALAAVRAKLAERYEKDERLASTARGRLDAVPSAEAAIEALARGSTPAEAVSHARSIVLSLSEELEVVESREYADLDSSSDLSALRDVVVTIAEEELGESASAREEGASRRRAEGLLDAYRATSPSRAVGRVIQEVDRVAGGEEDLAWKLRGARVWNWRGLRQLARTQREIARKVASARGLLARQLGEPEKLNTALREGLEAALQSIERAASAMNDASQAVAEAPVGEAAGDAGIHRATVAAGLAAGTLDGIAENLEALRASAMPDAVTARAWLRAQLGTIPERIARVAAEERSHASRAKELSAAEASDRAFRAAALLVAHEDTRRETESLASKTRKEGDRILAAGAGLDRLRAYDRAAVQLAAIAAVDLAEASRALRSTGSADEPTRAGLLLDAALREEKAAAKLDAVALALAAIDADEALRTVSKDVEDALGSLPQRDAAAGPSEDPGKIARDARVCLDASLKAAATLAPRVAKDPKKAPLLELLRGAAERFRQAIELAEKQEGVGAAAALASGRALLEDAVALARKLRGETGDDVASAAKSLERGAEEEAPPDENKEISRELEAAYAELERIIEAERLEKEIAARLDDLLSEEKPDPAQVEELEKKERDLEQTLGEKHLTTAELVELVSKLVAIDREGRDLSAVERSLAADAEKAARAETGGEAALARLEEPQAGAVRRARQLAKDFQTAGFRLSAVLPNVLRAWWKAGDAVEPCLAAMQGAAMEIASRVAPQRSLLDSATKMETFLSGVGDMRREALEAIADQERGGATANSAQVSLERARRNLSEAARLRREGENDASRRMRRSSLKSIADAAGALRSHIAELASSSGEEGSLMSRVLDEESARLGLGWQVVTRGSSRAGADRLRDPGSGEMPFPARFREWVRVYLRAIEK